MAMTVIESDWKWRYPLDRRHETRALVLHHSAGSGGAAAIHQLHIDNGWSGIGYHYYVRRDGSIYRGRPEDTAGCHAGIANTYSIAVCFEGNFENETMGEAQLAAGRELIADIIGRWGALEVLKHKDVSPTACPGRNFPFDGLLTAPEHEEPEQDNSPADWEKAPVEWALGLGIIAGDDRGDLALHSPVTKAQAAAMLHRYSRHVEKLIAGSETAGR